MLTWKRKRPAIKGAACVFVFCGTDNYFFCMDGEREP